MIIEVLNFLLISIIYLYLVNLYHSGCKCALTPNFYFLAVYISLSLLLVIAASMMKVDPKRLANVYMGIIFVYFVLTIIFIFITFGYVREIEQKQCECAKGLGEGALQILAWIRIFSFVLALFAVATMIKGVSFVKTPVR